MLVGHEGNANPDPETPTWEPWAKWIEVQQQLMATAKGTQMHQRKLNDRDQTGVREITIKMPVAMAQDPKAKW